VPDDMLADRWEHSGAPNDPPAHRRRAPGRPGLRQGLSVLLLALACAGLFVLYFHQSLSAPFNSDGAANVLQAQAIIHGNPLLRGWWTSDVSFYTTELPEYALVTAIHGLSPNVVHVCGALTYTLTVLLTALVARGREPGAAGYYRAGIAIGIVLALSVTGSIGIFLENPNHAGTTVPVLFFLLLLDRAGGGRGDRTAGRWHIPVAVCAVLALAEVGDKLTLAAATVPLGVVCAVRLTTGRLTTGRLTTGRLTTGPLLRGGERRRAAVLLERALLAAAVVSVGLAWLANLVIRALGGFDLRPVTGVAAARLSDVPANASTLWQTIVLLFGATQPGTPHQPQMISAHALVSLTAAFHVIGLLLAVVGLAAGIASLCSRDADRVAQVLVVAILILLAFGVFSTLLRSPSYSHEIAILLPLSAALAGRVLAPLAGRRLPARLRSASLPGLAFPLWSPGSDAARRRPVKIAVLALGAWLALNVAEVGYVATWPTAQPSQQDVAAWLAAHHERDGLAGYWQAASTTVTSGGQVLVAAITLSAAPAASRAAAGQAAAYPWETSADWYQPARHDATFVIAVADADVPGGGLSPAAVRAHFGPPAGQYLVGQYLVMTYRYNLLTRLVGTRFPGPG
jgi:hypothetical protein